uniref:Uncharacterized protein n=1 Tax=Arundo donax TaxID=35708 RepID=A0A0A9SNF2_ARUDO
MSGCASVPPRWYPSSTSLSSSHEPLHTLGTSQSPSPQQSHDPHTGTGHFNGGYP